MKNIEKTESGILSDEFSNSIWTFYETNLSKRTRKEYLNVVKDFVRFTNTDPLKLTKDAADNYSNHLIQKVSSNRLSYSTALMRISVMRSLCEYIRFRKNQQGLEYINYFQDIIMPDVDKTLQAEVLPTDLELNALLDMSYQKKDDKAFLIFSLVMKCGLTSSEISNLNVEHIVLDTKEQFCIQFPVKNKTSRIIRLPEDISELLNKYIDRHNLYEGAVFLNQRNTRLKVRDAQRILNQYIELGMNEGSIDKHFTFQDMRHAAFKYMLSGGASEEEVAKYCGITTKWLPRYRQLIHSGDELDGASYSILQIQPLHTTSNPL